MNIECNGDCFACEHMKNEDVDLLCPVRIMMLRTARIEQQLANLAATTSPKRKNTATVVEAEVEPELTKTIL